MERIPAATDSSTAAGGQELHVAADANNAADVKIHIAHIGGRYLVFDVADVVRLRRQHGICSVLVGITPQAPNQGLFSGLPLELAPDEVRWLVHDRQAAYVADDGACHLAALTSPAARRRYAESLARQRQTAQDAADRDAAERQKRAVEARAWMAAKSGKEGQNKTFENLAPAHTLQTPQVRITPTTSAGLVDGETTDSILPLLPPASDPTAASSYALRAHLANRGYFATPGLRFGGDLSVYPGDPFRYHAHFVATAYGWDEPIPLLDLVGTGRLATGVKKGLLIGGSKPNGSSSNDADDDGVRTFTLEWAAI